MVPGKSLAIISRTGQVWHPIGRPSGLARSSRAPAAPVDNRPATAACLPVVFRNSLLVVVDICPSKAVSKIHLLYSPAKHVRKRDSKSHKRTREALQAGLHGANRETFQRL